MTMSENDDYYWINSVFGINSFLLIKPYCNCVYHGHTMANANRVAHARPHALSFHKSRNTNQLYKSICQSMLLLSSTIKLSKLIWQPILTQDEICTVTRKIVLQYFLKPTPLQITYFRHSWFICQPLRIKSLQTKIVQNFTKAIRTLWSPSKAGTMCVFDWCQACSIHLFLGQEVRSFLVISFSAKIFATSYEMYKFKMAQINFRILKARAFVFGHGSCA